MSFLIHFWNQVCHISKPQRIKHYPAEKITWIHVCMYDILHHNICDEHILCNLLVYVQQNICFLFIHFVKIPAHIAIEIWKEHDNEDKHKNKRVNMLVTYMGLTMA